MTTPRPDHDPDVPDPESHLMAAQLRALRTDLTPPDATLQRLTQRLQDTTRAHPRPVPAGWMRRLGGVRMNAVLGLLAVCIAGAILLASLPNRSVSAAEMIQRATDYANQPIAAGTVRHVVYEGVATDPRGTQRFIDEIWLTPGTNHLLVMQPARRPVPGSTLLDPIGTIVIDEAAVWTVDLTARTVTRAPFSELCSLQSSDWFGDAAMVATMAHAPGVTVVGTEVLDGRETTKLAWATYMVWFETTSGRLVRFDDSATGTTYQKTILVDEVLDRSAVPADRFSFSQPAGTTLVSTDQPCN
jgi:hypothetical protein